MPPGYGWTPRAARRAVEASGRSTTVLMFDSLSERLQGVFRTLRGEARLSEPVVESALREIRMVMKGGRVVRE